MPDQHDEGGIHERHSQHEHEGAFAARRLRSLEDALVEAGVVGLDEVDDVLDRFPSRANPANGARLIARAWLDPEFGSLPFQDGNAAVEAMGMSVVGPHSPHRFRAVPNSDAVHNLIVCTLCSCYPMALLGPSPGWYRSFEYRARAVREPKAVLAEFGIELDSGVTVDVWDSTAEVRYLVVRQQPAGTDSLCEAELAQLVTRPGMIGAGWV